MLIGKNLMNSNYPVLSPYKHVTKNWIVKYGKMSID